MRITQALAQKVRDHRDSVNRIRKKCVDLVFINRSMPRSDDVDALTTPSKSSFVEKSRRERGSKSSGNDERPPVIQITEHAGQRRLYVIGVHQLIADVDVRFVIAAEVVVDLDVVLFAIACGFACAPKIVDAAIRAQISKTGSVEAIADFVIVGCRVKRHHAADVSRRIQLLAKPVPASTGGGQCSNGYAVGNERCRVDRGIRAIVRRRLALQGTKHAEGLDGRIIRTRY